MELLNLKDALISKLPYHKKRILDAFTFCDLDLKTTMSNYINAQLRLGINIDFLAESYSFFLRETFREQAALWVHKEYSNYGKNGIKAVYKDDEYMKRFMIGLGMSTFLWPQHRKQFAFFNEFIKKMDARNTDSAYLEIGAGQGLLASDVLSKNIFSSYDFIDISKEALSITKAILDEMFINYSINYMCRDFLDFEGNSFYDLIVANEVLPNFENPILMLKKCLELVSGENGKRGKVYVSTPINAPIMNGISPFKSLPEIETLINYSGLKILDKIVVPTDSYNVYECERLGLPINVSFILIA